MDKKTQNKRWKQVMVIGIIAIVIVSIVIVIQAINGNAVIDDIFYSPDPYNTSVPYDLFKPKGLNTTVQQLSVEPVYNQLTKDYRPRWEGCTDEEYLQIFGNLPEFPQDFYKKYSMFMKGELTDYDRLGPEYWQQPEFYDMNQVNFNSYYQRSTTMWTPGTVSCKPTFRLVEMMKGASVELSTFFHNDILGSEAYVAGVFYPVLPDLAQNYEGVKAFDQPPNAKDYIKVKIVSPENDPIFMAPSFQQNIKGLYIGLGEDERIGLFPSTYRKIDTNGEKSLLGFDPEWCKKVTIEISIEKNFPAGDYIVGVDVKNPSISRMQEYNWVISGNPYYSFFFPAVREWRPVCPFFQIIVTVL